MPLYVSRRCVVVPGDVIGEGEDFRISGQGFVKVNNKYVAIVLSLVDVQGSSVNVIPLEGPYMPKVGDVVIGLVKDVGITSWLIDIKAPYSAVLHVSEALTTPFNPLKDNIRKYLDVGDLIIAKIISFDRAKDPMLTIKGRGLGKITSGMVVEVAPSKVPRIIGRRGSMVNMLKNELGCNIVVGLNGRVWIDSSDPEVIDVFVKAIRMIEAEAHTTGLTDRVREFVRSEKKRRGL